MQQARLRRPERPERRKSPENQTRYARVNLHPSEKPNMPCIINHPSRLASRHRQQYTLPEAREEEWHFLFDFRVYVGFLVGTAISRTIERPAEITSRLRGTSNNRGHCSSGSDEDGPTKRCSQTKGAEQTRHRRSKMKQKMQRARLRRPERPERRNIPENQATNARINPHPRENSKIPCRINHPSRLASRHRQQS